MIYRVAGTESCTATICTPRAVVHIIRNRTAYSMNIFRRVVRPSRASPPVILRTSSCGCEVVHSVGIARKVIEASRWTTNYHIGDGVSPAIRNSGWDIHTGISMTSNSIFIHEKIGYTSKKYDNTSTTFTNRKHNDIGY